MSYEDTLTEYLGVDSCHGSITGEPKNVNEVVLRVGVKDADRSKVDRFGRELAPLVTSGPPGVTGFAGGRPKATQISCHCQSGARVMSRDTSGVQPGATSAQRVVWLNQDSRAMLRLIDQHRWLDSR